MIRSITPFLWYERNAEEAARFYCSIFPDSSVDSVSPMVVEFTLQGQSFMALNGGPAFHFTEAISLYVSVETQAEVDELWDKLLAGGGEPSRCGWLKDKYGLSWQIIPTALTELLSHDDDQISQTAMTAMLGMSKIDIAGLRQDRAHAGTN